MAKVAVILLTYNGAGVISRFLDTYQAFTNPAVASLIVVDNNSHDKTLLLVEKALPHATIIRNSINTGFALGCNIGMRAAMEEGCEYVFLANQDLSFGKGWLEPLIFALDSHKKIAAIQSEIFLYPETNLINSCGNALHYLGFGYTLGYRKKQEEWSCQDVRPVAYCSGAAVMYRVEYLRKSGLFDESFFMYHEDTDLSWRLRLAGYQVAVQPASRVYHEYEFSRSIQKFYYIERNRLLTVFKNYQIKTLALIFPMLLVWEAGLFFYAFVGLVSGKKTIGFKEKILEYGYFLSFKNIQGLIRERALVQKMRVIPDREIVKLFTSSIEFQDVESPLLNRIANPLTRWYWERIRPYV